MEIEYVHRENWTNALRNIFVNNFFLLVKVTAFADANNETNESEKRNAVEKSQFAGEIETFFFGGWEVAEPGGSGRGE